MALKEKILGLILIILGAFPFLLKIKFIGDYFAKYKFFSYIVPGEAIHQIIIIIIGILLAWSMKPRQRMPRY